MTGRVAALPLVAVVAMGQNRVIGREGAMPWQVPSDLKRYRRLTMGKPMIMGRKTLVSIGRVLDGRDSIVLTRGAGLPFEGALAAASKEEALALAEACARSRGSDEIVIAGGEEIYRLFFEDLDRLYVTEVMAMPGGDARFPEIDPAVFEPVLREEPQRGERDSAATRFVIYQRAGADRARRWPAGEGGQTES
ncbi:dihydrofolate reductase [Jiella sonneratiae]|uniref:Dihydrofolate reductase n=1 Tax=Jiella sonneratiae TaxID=2816856 RepID=A0ABS3J095_9HYPH|nr:dihydrofolate reductase [Jiella sonneratiae]MBO0903084.1 dihydrofolate reductase [Jiella sonneratiae]